MDGRGRGAAGAAAAAGAGGAGRAGTPQARTAVIPLIAVATRKAMPVFKVGRLGIQLFCAALVLPAACNGNVGGRDGGGGGGLGGIGGSDTFVPTRQIDVVFVVDDAPGMEATQANLALNVPSFFVAFRNLVGGLPDMHIAVVSSDMNA